MRDRYSSINDKAMYMHCTNCGNSIEAASKFCSNCGTPAVNSPASVSLQPTYSFVVTGEIVNGQTLDVVKNNLEKFIKLDRNKLDVIFAKKNVVLKKDIDKETAEKYKKAFAKCGAICNIIENVTNIITNDKSTDASAQPQQSKSNLSEAVDSENNPESTIDKENHSKISLWNPNAAANWSILFTPIFGAYLHSKNWAALGNKEKEKQSMYWTYGAIGVFILSLFLPGLGPAISIGYLLGWYFSIAKMQAKHVKEELDNNYEKNNWLKPIGVASSCLFALIIVLSIAAPNQGNSARLDARIDAAAKEENVAQAKAAEKAKKETSDGISKYVVLEGQGYCFKLGAFKALMTHMMNDNHDGTIALVDSGQCGVIPDGDGLVITNDFQVVNVVLLAGAPAAELLKIRYPNGRIIWVGKWSTTLPYDS